MSERVYYPQLDGLRFIAFLLVFAFHGGFPWLADFLSLITLPIFLIAQLFGSEAAGHAAAIGPSIGNALRLNGWTGVQLFFVLSGYLITTLLLREEREYGRIDLRAFWIRRILRIWPLYYLIIALAFFAVPALSGEWGSPTHRNLLNQLPWFLVFLGNWSMIVQGPVGSDQASILWSVCAEEQFYILCPLLIAFIPRRARLPVVCTLMCGGIGYRAWLAWSIPKQWEINYNVLATIDTLLSGVALAILVDRGSIRAPSPRVSRIIGWVLIVGILALFRNPVLAHMRPWRQTVDFALIWLTASSVVAYLVICESRGRRWLSWPPIVWLGRISYGLYMYHEIVLHAVPPLPALGLTVAIAAASYYLFERSFLRLKGRWTRVASRPV